MANKLLNNNEDISIQRQRFIKIAERRVNMILDALDHLSNCANRKNYEYTEDEIKKIFKEIDRKVKETKLKFQYTDTTKKRFKLK